MQFNEIHALVGKVPYISETNAKLLYDLIINQEKENILELGIAHGTATCYIAAALQELGRGTVTSVDLIEVKDHFKPSAEEQIKKTGLSDYVDIHRMQSGYTWFLHDAISQNIIDDKCQEIYDLCIIDGPKNWTIDSSAFFLVDKLLKQNSHLIFDDYHWTYAGANSTREATDGITHRSLSQDEQNIPHIKQIFELLVKQHPNYGNFTLFENNDWAMAQKQHNPEKTYTVNYQINTLGKIARRMKNLFNK